MARQLDLIDNLVAEGKEEFTFEEAMAELGSSPTSTANVLLGLRKKGLVDRLSPGRYAIRPMGSLRTSAATADLDLAVGVAFDGRTHRIAYLSALSELGLQTHPVKKIFVACTRQVRLSKIGSRPLRVLIENEKTIHLEAERINRAWISKLERALFECALRVDLSGGVDRLAEALARGGPEADPSRIARLAKAFGARGLAAERRLASLSTALSLGLALEPQFPPRRPIIRLDPRDSRVEWIDDVFRVAWNMSPDELAAVIGN
jgi:predicted transcriptional regulator of viral defense system